jgi:16S rRNA (cytosine1402-N4)-methyltransferase
MSSSNSQEGKSHIPVMPEEVMNYLAPKKGAFIIDGTTGEGGHSLLIAGRIGPQGKLLCCDVDSELIEIAKRNLSQVEPAVIFIRSDYKALPKIIESEYEDRPDGILIDLGACSRHFDSAERGFSFRLEGPLDMRFNRQTGRTAADLVNSLTGPELERIFREYGEEKKARSVARAIVDERASNPIETTVQLAKIVRGAAGRQKGNIDAATRVFQALRIAVNSELEGLREFIMEAVRLLKPGGKMVVISFHSLEDRIVKDTFRYLASDCICPSNFPVCRCEKKSEVTIFTRKPVIPSEKEAKENPRSRSAKLRACGKLDQVR